MHEVGEENSRVTREVVNGLVPMGFMIDHAVLDEKGSFMRCVVSRGTGRETVEGLVEAVVDLGGKIWMGQQN